jgi:hypothetical protein
MRMGYSGILRSILCFQRWGLLAVLGIPMAGKAALRPGRERAYVAVETLEEFLDVEDILHSGKRW